MCTSYTGSADLAVGERGELVIERPTIERSATPGLRGELKRGLVLDQKAPELGAQIGADLGVRDEERRRVALAIGERRHARVRMHGAIEKDLHHGALLVLALEHLVVHQLGTAEAEQVRPPDHCLGELAAHPILLGVLEQVAQMTAADVLGLRAGVLSNARFDMPAMPQ